MGERVFALPDLGEGLDEAVVNEWLAAEGDEVELNQPIAELETAKAVVELPSPYSGRIVRLHAPPGSAIAVGAPLVTFEVADADATEEPGEAGPEGAEPGEAAPVAATPAVRALAKRLGVDLSSVRPTGPGGRLTSDDVEGAAATGAAATEGADHEVVPVGVVRRSVAENLERIAAVPQVTTFRRVDCSALEDYRRALGGSPLPVFVRALAEVVAEHPWINASWERTEIHLHRSVNVGVATDTERGLVVPVIRDARSLGIEAITARIAELAQTARAGTLSPKDTTGATIAVTNTGSYGSESGTPLLNPGHAVTIALGAIRPRALVVEGRVQARPACTLSLTFDHRVLDGATVGRALGALVELLESPERLRALPR
jgi:2-oxoisovalerate dehydrogenase E2 component (dihydrolipoyl transacylase)